MEAAKKVLSAKRSILTRHLNACETFVTNVDSLETSSLEMAMIDKLNELCDKVESSMSNLEEAFDSSSELLNAESFNKENSLLDEFSNGMCELRSRILNSSTRIRTQVQMSVTQASPSPSNPHVPSSPRINVALKPDKLLASSTLAEFRSWSTDFRLFYSSNHMETFSIAEQQGYLRSCLELKLQQILMTKCEEDTPVLGEDGCIAKLREIFVQYIPLLTRRYNFFRCDQRPGERFSDWYLRLQLEGQEAELSSIGEDELFVLRLVTGSSDKRLREEFLRQSDPSRDLLHRMAMAWESAHDVESAISSSDPIATIAATSSYKKSKSGWKNKTEQESSPDRTSSWKCLSCGYSSHPKGLSREQCPARDKMCHKCDKPGHFASVCGHRRRDESPPGNSRPISSAVIHVNSVKTRPTPTASVEVRPRSGTPFHMLILPDTGATETLISEDLVKTYGIKVYRSQMRSIRAANNSTMKCFGAVELEISHLGKYSTSVWAYVTPNIRDQLLLSWHSMIPLGMLPPTFPRLPEDVPPSISKVEVRSCTLGPDEGGNSFDWRTVHQPYLYRRGEAEVGFPELDARTTNKLATIPPQTIVQVQNPRTKKWGRLAVVLRAKNDGRSYKILLDDRIIIRNRCHLRPHGPHTTPSFSVW